MKRAVLYLRVSTIDQKTANQERELRQIAGRMGCKIVKVYKDHGISGAKGRDKRPAFDAPCRDASRRQFDVVMAWSVDRLRRSLKGLVGFLSELHALSIYSCISAGPRHHHASREGDVRHARGVCRVRALDDPGTCPCWPEPSWGGRARKERRRYNGLH